MPTANLHDPLLHLALTPPVYGDQETAKVVLHLWIRNEGTAPLQITGIRVGSARSIALASPAELDEAVADHARAGLHLVHVSAVNDGRGVTFSAVFHERADGSATTVVRHGLTAAALQAEALRGLDRGSLIRALASYTVDGERRFVAAWR